MFLFYSMPYRSRGLNKSPATWAPELSFSPCSCQVSSYSRHSLPPTPPSYPVEQRSRSNLKSISHHWSVIEMKKPFNDLTELEKSGFKIGGLDTGATRTIFQVTPLSPHHHWANFALQSGGKLNKDLVDSRWEGVANFAEVLKKAESDPEWASISPTQSIYLTMREHGVKCAMTGNLN